MQETRINVRIDKDLKDRADVLFDRLGLNMSTAISIFLKKTVEEQAIPFVVGTKSLTFAGGLTSSDITRLFNETVVAEISLKENNNVPVAKYDSDKKQAYLEYADGKKEYIPNEQ
ncbi:MAG: type II toxin-antitoxin system RelB/DinJ family antitoxin [Eubacteriales bacterium]